MKKVLPHFSILFQRQIRKTLDGICSKFQGLHNAKENKIREEIMKLKWIPVILFVCISCSSVTQYSFNNLKAVKPDPSQELQILVGNGSEIGNGINNFFYKNGKENPITRGDLDSRGMAVALKNETIISNSSPLLTYLSYFTLCLLPCEYTTVYDLDVDYINYTTKREPKPGSFESIIKIKNEKVFLSEKIRYSVYYRGFFTEGLDESNKKGIIRGSGISYSKDSSPLLLHLENNYKTVVDKINEERKEIYEKEKISFTAIDKKNCKALYEFPVSDDNEELNSIKNKASAECVDAKLIKILSQKYPFAKSHLTKKVFLMQKDLEISFYDLWNTVILAKNSKTGFKISQEDFNLTQQGKDKLRLKIKTLDGSTIVFIFQPNDKSIIVTNIETKEQVGNWEETLEPVLKKFAEWPAPENWDWEYLNLKGVK